MRMFFVWFILTSLSYAMENGQDNIPTLETSLVAHIIKIEGKAKILSKSSIKKHKAKQGEALFKGDKLITYKQSKALVELEDGSHIILNEGAELTFVDKMTVKHEMREAYYKIKKRQSTQGFTVKTPFSIMGIKGTEFIVDTQGNGVVSLNEGRIGIKSWNADFELHKSKLMADYEKFKNEQTSAFEAYKAEFTGKTVSYVKAFDLEAGKTLYFSDADNCKEACESQVNEETISEDFRERFKMYKNMLEE